MHGHLPKTTLVVPCFNEADRLPVDLLGAFVAAEPQVRLLLVNDGSVDGTADLLAALASAHDRQIRVLHTDRNRGKAEAVRTGVLAVADDPQDTEWVGYWDADMAAPPEQLRAFFREIEGRDADIVIGSRVKRMGARIVRRPIRHILGRVFATVVSLGLDLPVYDTQCGAKLFRLPLVEPLFREPFVSRWLFDVELLVRALQCMGRPAVMERLVEVPLLAWRDVPGSKMKWRALAAAPFELLRIFAHYRR